MAPKMTSKPKKSTRQPVKSTAKTTRKKATPKKARLKQLKRYRSFQLSPKLNNRPPVSGFWVTNRQAWQQLAPHWLDFIKLGTIILIVGWVLVYGFGSTIDLPTQKANLTVGDQTDWSTNLAISFELLGQLFNRFLPDFSLASNFSSLNILLLLLASLATITLIRQRHSKKSQPLTVADTVYFGPSQIVPFICIGLILFIQLLPLLIANNVVLSLKAGGVLTTGASQALVLVAAGLINIWSLYLVSGSIIGLFVVSLPGTRPLDAWQTSWSICHNRRGLIARQLLAWFVLLLISTTLVMLPVVWWLTPIAEYIFYAWLVIIFLVGQVGFYQFYLNLINN